MVKMIKCKCERRRPVFVFDDQGQCDHCRMVTLQKVPKDRSISWSDIRQERNRLLQECDWTQLGDVPAETKEKWKGYRRRLRNITKVKKPSNIKWPIAPE